MLLMNLTNITNGSKGHLQTRQTIHFWNVFTSGTFFYYFIFILVAVLLFLLNRVINSRTGGHGWPCERMRMSPKCQASIHPNTNCWRSRWELLSEGWGRHFRVVAGIDLPR
jgi:hypothetical protein